MRHEEGDFEGAVKDYTEAIRLKQDYAAYLPEDVLKALSHGPSRKTRNLIAVFPRRGSFEIRSERFEIEALRVSNPFSENMAPE